MTAPDLPAVQSVSGSTIRAEANRATVYRVMDAVRASGTPGSQPQLVAETGLSAVTVSKYANAYTREVNAELLGWGVEDEAAFQEWTALYRSFAVHVRASSEAHAVQTRFLRLAIESLDRAGQPVTHSAVDALTGVGWDRVLAAMRAWEAETGKTRVRGRSWSPVTLDMVLPLIDPALHHLPLTFLDDPRAYRPLTTTSLRMIHGLSQPRLRDTAFLCLAIAETDLKNDSRFFWAFANHLSALGLADIDQIDPDAFYAAFHDGQVLPKVGKPLRTGWLQTYFRLLRKQDDYFGRLTPGQADSLVPFRLRPVSNASFWRRSLLFVQVRDESRGRRKAATAAVHNKFYLFRNIAERRLNQLVRLRQAFQDACGRVRQAGAVASFPVAFAYTEEAVTPAGAARTVTHRFRLWDGHALRCAHAPVAPKRYYEAPEYGCGIELGADLLFLSYEGATAAAETVEPAEFWFADLTRAGGLTYDPDPAFLAAHGYAKAALYQPVRPDWTVSTGTWLKRLSADLGLLFLPVDTLLAAGLIGQAVLQVMTKTGARIGEVMQIRLTPEHLARAELPGGKEVIAFRAKPKGRTAEEPFYIDGRCLKALHAWFSFLRERGGGAVVLPPTFQLREKCGPAPYLLQFRGRHLGHKDLNACLRILLHGIEVSTAQDETVRLSTHLLRHGFATEMRQLEVPMDVIALLIKQRDVDVTRFYAQPTPAQMVEVQERIFLDRIDLTRTHLRTPATIRRQMESAQGGVGALVPVVGGTCTVANMCPVKFACLGCAGNAPDPAKRAQVEEFKRIYEDMMRLAAGQGLRAEERKARGAVAGCEDMLAEMALIEAAECDGAQAAEVRYAEAGQHQGKREKRR